MDREKRQRYRQTDHFKRDGKIDVYQTTDYRWRDWGIEHERKGKERQSCVSVSEAE